MAASVLLQVLIAFGQTDRGREIRRVGVRLASSFATVRCTPSRLPMLA